MATSIYPNQFRADSTILPVITSDLSCDIGFLQIGNWQYLPYLNEPVTLIPYNRTEKIVPILLKNNFFPDADITYDSGISQGVGARIERDSGEGYNGAYTDNSLDQDFCSVQAKAVSTELSCGISLQDASDGVVHTYTSATVRHSITLGQHGQGSIRENGALVSNNAYFKYEINDTVMIEVRDGIARYYLIKPDGTMKVLRTTRSKLTEDARAEFLLYFAGSALFDVCVFSNDFEETSYESIGVAYFRADLKQLYWMKPENQRSLQSIADSIEMADKRTQQTYGNQKKQLIAHALTPKAFSITDYWKFQEFVKWHDISKEFIFIDYARKLDGVPTEFWAKFSSAFTDATRNGCQFDESVAILEDFRNDYIPRQDDTTPPEVEIDSVEEGSAILAGTASDNVLLISLQVYVNGYAHGDTFLPENDGTWEYVVPTEDLISGINSFYVIATDYAGNTTQSNTETLNTGSPDASPPTVPTGLALSVISDTQINVSWSASSDDTAVTGYDLQRATDAGFTTGLTTINLGNVLSYNNTGLAASTQYFYRVRAHDAIPNNSAYSASQNATTNAPDTTAPTTPTGFSATTFSSSRIDLAWSASTDAVGVTAYELRRATDSGFTTGVTDINVGNVLSYSNTGLAGSTTYYYKVRARDAAGNWSSYSSVDSDTTSGASLTNFALASNGSTASASSVTTGGNGAAAFAASRAINGYRHTDNNWNGTSSNGSGWNGGGLPAWLEVDFGTTRSIEEIDVYTLADAVNYNTNPTLSDVFSAYGIVDFTASYWNGSSWVVVGTATANDKVWRQFTFSPVSTTKIRIDITSVLAGEPRIIEVEAWG